MLIEDLPFLFGGSPFHSVECEVSGVQISTMSLWPRNDFLVQYVSTSLDATAVNLARSLGTWILLEGFWIAPSETCGGFIFLQTHICNCMSIGGVTTFGVGDVLRLQCAGGAFCLIGLPLTVHGGWEEALGKISVIRGAGAAATSVEGTNWWQLIFSNIICKLLFTGICSSPCESEPWQDDTWNPCRQNICEMIRLCISRFRIASLYVFYQPFSIVCTKNHWPIGWAR